MYTQDEFVELVYKATELQSSVATEDIKCNYKRDKRDKMSINDRLSLDQDSIVNRKYEDHWMHARRDFQWMKPFGSVCDKMQVRG
ncbi:hypothetical protein LXL04_000501 [Taraxacum kok-saghyz]